MYHKERMMILARRITCGMAMVSTLGAFAIVFGSCSTDTTSAQEPAWHAPFNQATAAGRAWSSAPRVNNPTRGYIGRTSQGASVWRQNQQTVRHYSSLPPYPPHRMYATPAPRRWTEVTRPTRSWSSSSARPFRGLFARRWR